MTAVEELLDTAERVPFAVWALIVGAFAFSVLALVVLARSERATLEERARIRDEYLAWRHPRARVHRNRHRNAYRGRK